MKDDSLSIHMYHFVLFLGFPGGLSITNPHASTGDIRDSGLILGLGRSPGGGHVVLPGKFHGQRSLSGYSPWGREESDMTEAT